MTIPIENIYYLLSYAWDTLEEGETVSVDVDDCPHVLDLLGRVLANGVDHLIRRGIDRDYIANEEILAGIRGRLLLDGSIKAMTFPAGKALCQFDELSHDVLHNQIIRSTMARMARMREVTADVRAALHATVRRLPEISEIRIDAGCFRRVQLHRNNRVYRLLMQVCRLIHANLLVGERGGDVLFQDFIRDKKQMWQLFQRFVRNFYDRELRNFYDREQDRFKVTSEQFSWQDAVGTDDALAYLPKMVTDVSLISDERRVIIDTKYYANALRDRFESQKIITDHLYQLFAYLRNSAVLSGRQTSVEGILLYPAVNQNFRMEYVIHGHRIQVASVDLNQEWRRIKDDLLGLVIDIPSAAAAVS